MAVTVIHFPKPVSFIPDVDVEETEELTEEDVSLALSLKQRFSVHREEARTLPADFDVSRLPLSDEEFEELPLFI